MSAVTSTVTSTVRQIGGPLRGKIDKEDSRKGSKGADHKRVGRSDLVRSLVDLAIWCYPRELEGKPASDFLKLDLGKDSKETGDFLKSMKVLLAKKFARKIGDELYNVLLRPKSEKPQKTLAMLADTQIEMKRESVLRRTGLSGEEIRKMFAKDEPKPKPEPDCTYCGESGNVVAKIPNCACTEQPVCCIGCFPKVAKSARDNEILWTCPACKTGVRFVQETVPEYVAPEYYPLDPEDQDTEESRRAVEQYHTDQQAVLLAQYGPPAGRGRAPSIPQAVISLLDDAPASPTYSPTSPSYSEEDEEIEEEDDD